MSASTYQRLRLALSGLGLLAAVIGLACSLTSSWHRGFVAESFGLVFFAAVTCLYAHECAWSLR